MTRKYKLDDICDFINGGAWSDKEYSHKGIPVLKVSNFKPNGFEIDSPSYLPTDALTKYEKNLLTVNDLAIATVGSHPNLTNSAAGRSCIIPESISGYLLNQNAVCVRSKDEDVLNQKYLCYLGQTHEFKHYIQSRGKGAANQMRIAIGAIKDYEVVLPPLPTQRRIAEILSAYDDLIENNQKQIKLLEEAAMLLYKEWFVKFKFPGYEKTEFVDGLPVGWKKEKIGNLLSKIEITEKIKTSEIFKEGSIPVIDQSRDYIAGYTNNLSAKLTNVPAIIFGDHTRILKFVNFPFARGADGTQVLISNDLSIPQHLFFLSISNVNLSNFHYARHFKYLKEFVITVPTEKIASKFEIIIKTQYGKILCLRSQIQQASTARDKLLPKLMNGEIEV